MGGISRGVDDVRYVSTLLLEMEKAGLPESRKKAIRGLISKFRSTPNREPSMTRADVQNMLESGSSVSCN